jgi:2-polyprenyl-6-methoxyphenol hydroxylase-like FAD-dependent oxidoreductase
MIRGSSTAFGYTVSPAGETYWFARLAADELAPDEIADSTPGQWRDRLLPALRADRTPAADIVAATDDLLATNAYDLPSVPVWRGDRALLIGDAAHAASPATGQGASMALEDAVVLAKALRDNDSVESALALYERLRRPRVEHNIAASAALTARQTSPARPPAAAPTDDQLRQQLDWRTALPVVDSGS